MNSTAQRRCPFLFSVHIWSNFSHIDVTYINRNRVMNNSIHDCICMYPPPNRVCQDSILNCVQNIVDLFWYLLSTSSKINSISCSFIEFMSHSSKISKGHLAYLLMSLFRPLLALLLLTEQTNQVFLYNVYLFHHDKLLYLDSLIKMFFHNVNLYIMEKHITFRH